MPSRRFLDRLRRRGARRRGQPVALEVGPDLEDRDAQRVRDVVTRLLQRHDTTTQRADVTAIADAYSALADRGRVRFFSMLARDFWTDPATVDHAIAARRTASDAAARRGAERELRQALIPPATRLLQLFAGIDDGVKFLIDLRADELRLASDPAIAISDAAVLADLDQELKAQLARLFDAGLLELRRITWDAPASLLEKLIEYEAVHEITGWKDLRRRLEGDRRCFAFFHPALPHEPLIFIEVALTRGMSASVQPLLAPDAPTLDPNEADTAVFYSITNCQEGLRGVSFGNLLIKQVAQRLGQEFPRMKTFTTLSPVPGFRAWLAGAAPRLAETREAEAALQAVRRLEEADWHKQPATAEAARKGLLPLCAYYLVNGGGEGNSVDPVARFHLGNGARLERINWLADTSRRGIQQSAGMMVNYLYRLDQVEANHEAFVRDHRVVASAEIRKLARECPLAKAKPAEERRPELPRSVAPKPAS